MTCRELIEFLMEYTEGELAPAVRAEFDRHLSLCPSCVAYLEGYRRTVAMAREARGGDEEVGGAGVPRGLVEAVEAAWQKAQRVQ